MAITKFRTLKPNEIELRVGSVSKAGASLLLYKDARCDMNILDETVGPMNWQREHSRDNANCTVSIWDEDKSQWVSKEDTGTESFTEREKGLASDSFKRACVNWGIGRELYTAPFIFIKCATTQKSGGKGYELAEKFLFANCKVSEIEYDEARTITDLVIVDEAGRSLYNYHNNNIKKKSREDMYDEIKALIQRNGLNEAEVLKKIGIDSLAELETDRMPGCIQWLKGLK